MLTVGVDLSGPRNSSDTALAWFREDEANLAFEGSELGVTDAQIGEYVERFAHQDDVLVGLDAPLSYGVHTGSRPSDADLRRRLISLGAPPGSVMAPTAPRMAYLTLRGIVVARLLCSLRTPHRIRLVEVHPGAALLLRGVPPECVREMKRSAQARRQILDLMKSAGLCGITGVAGSDHVVAACAGAWAAWDWMRGVSRWLWKAEPPAHPFDFAS